MTRRPVPVVILAGFLGAGKTTLLNHVLSHADGRRIGVLVNDFGSINVDALLVSGAAGGTLTLENGCMCCTTDADGLGEAVASLSAPRAGLDAILIEASGIAEPSALIRLVLAACGPTASYGGLVYVIDAPALTTTLDEFPAIAGHIAIADLVVCNKADLVDDATLDRVRAIVVEANPTASSLIVTDAAVDPGLLFDEAAHRPVDDGGARQLSFDELLAADHDHDHDDHLHAAFTSTALQTADSVDPRRLARFLERPPTGAYRIKGEVLIDLPGHRDRAHVIQAVGGIVRVSTAPWSGRVPSTSLVVIGAGLDVDEADAALAGVVGAPDPADAHGILHVTRYIAEPSTRSIDDPGSAEQWGLQPGGVDSDPSADDAEGVDEP
ncbi:CobW family GTP-binding protein [Gordonia humi]|uniref:G3E family GTPase n=1 Tax=Gordonia humi TaxID=686429 RepID=A0A840F6D9_9ACTN|nr:GTP-binding protein [Gordonia humi]MBB4137456.1 G3E family GTPase [Gordonia humi]